MKYCMNPVASLIISSSGNIIPPSMPAKVCLLLKLIPLLLWVWAPHAPFIHTQPLKNLRSPTMFTLIYPCSLFNLSLFTLSSIVSCCTITYPCLSLCTNVYHNLLQFTYIVYLSLYNIIIIYLPLFTHVYIFVHMFILITVPPTFTIIYPCSPFFTRNRSLPDQ